MKKLIRQLSIVVLFFALFVQSFAPVDLLNVKQAESYIAEAAGSEYGLPGTTEEGVIFHAWNWSFDTIRSRLPEIAAAGYKSIQTSPIQGTKESTMTGSYWWVLYQPVNFNIGNAQLGSRDQFRQLCEEAERYGINIIVDVVANHTANSGGGTLQYIPAANVDSSIRNNSNFWHEARGVDNWNDRWQVTQLGIGLPDLNTGNQELQDKIIAFLNDAVSLGADGFRFDAAKHIELPTDPYGSSNFWSRVLGSLQNRSNLYIYGEVLQGGADAFAQYANYMDVTASYYGDSVRHAVGFNSTKNVNQAKEYNAAGVSASKLVTWVESHDTYANDGNESTYMSEWHLKMGWAIIASRAQSVSLFFNRPAGGGKFASSLGIAGNDLWKDADVVAVNKFHNAMTGQGEYLRTQGNEIMLIERGTKGMTIVNLGGDAYIDQPTNLASGTYTNKATGGGTFTVANGKITGNIGGGKIAVLYQEDTVVTPSISINQQEGSFTSDSLAVKITLANATNGTYTINGGSPVAFASGDTVTLGAGAGYGTTFALAVTANGTAGSVVKTYTFTKENPNALVTVHYYKPASWGTPNVYYYDDSATPVKVGAAWPGVAMTSEGNGWYSYTIPSWSNAKVIFNSNGNQVPAAQQPGYTVSGEKWIKNGVITSSNPDVAAPVISINQAEGEFTSESLQVAVQLQNTQSASYVLNGGAATVLQSGGTITLGAGDPGNTSYTLTITAVNGDLTTTKTYSFIKKQAQTQSFTVHYYKPTSWGTPNVYIYDDSVSPIKQAAAWPGTAMTNEGNGWYSYTVTGWDKARIIFNSNGQQMPAAQQAGYLVTGNAWIKDGVVSSSAPNDQEQATTVKVTFTVQNATTVIGQNVYLVGNIAELGNWNTSQAVGPGAAANYPTWSFTVNLPVGKTIEFKAIKKDANNNVVWESGANRSYTVSADNPNVTFSFR